MSGFKVTKDRLTPFLGANAPGGLKLKPKLTYHYENPTAFKNEASFPPVILEQNNKILVTTYLFTTWFTEKFKPTLDTYFTKTKNNLSKYYSPLTIHLATQKL